VKRILEDKWQAAASAVALIPAVAGDAHACAMCGLPAGDIATHAYNTSVLFLLTVPYAIVASAVVVGYVAYRKARRREADAEYNTPGPESVSNR
jgi:hypothetical protein